MPLIEGLQSIASAITARDAMALVVLITTCCTGFWALLRQPEGWRHHRVALAAMTVGSLLLVLAPRGWLATPVVVAAALFVVGGFTLHALHIPIAPDIQPATSTSKRAAVVWMGLASALAALFLLADLAGYSGSLMVWEPESMRGLVEAAKNDISWLRFAASRLLWGRGLVSTGHDSLFYGSGTYGLWHLTEVSRTSLRLMAAVFAAGSLCVAYWACRAYAGRTLAAAAVVVIATNPVLLFYGRYGVSLSATFFATLLLVGVILRLTHGSREGWHWGLAAGGTAFLATLGYATGRVATVAIVATTLLFATISWRHLTRRQRQAFLVMAAVLAGVTLIQTVFNRSREFVDVNSEHIMTANPRMVWVRELMGPDLDPTELEIGQRLEMTAKVVVSASEDLSRMLSFPFQTSTDPWVVVHGDPPEIPLAHGPILLFAVWGLVCSLVMWRARWSMLLFVLLAATSLPLLFTNRIDMHRLSLSMLPIVLFAATGLLVAAHVMRDCGVPKTALHFAAALLVVLVAVDDSSFLFDPEPPRGSPLVARVRSEVDASGEPLAVGIADDFKAEAEIELFLLARELRDPEDPDHRGELLWQETVQPLSDPKGADLASVVVIERTLHDATVLLAPQKKFDDAIDRLRARGMEAQAVGDEPFSLWRLDRLRLGEFRVTGGDETVVDRNPRPRRYRETRRPVVRGSAPVIAADVREVFHRSKPPHLIAGSWEKPIMMADAAHTSAIRMSAWTHLDIDVPTGASTFQAFIGFADEVAECDRARASFEVWGDNNRRLFDSGPMTPGDGPRHIVVALRSASVITLVVTEAGNGYECDEVVWADPVFRLTH